MALANWVAAWTVFSCHHGGQRVITTGMNGRAIFLFALSLLACSTRSDPDDAGVASSSDGGVDAGDAADAHEDAEVEAGPCPDGEKICAPGSAGLPDGCFCNNSDWTSVCAPDGCSYVCNPCPRPDAGEGGSASSGNGGLGGGGAAN